MYLLNLIVCIVASTNTLYDGLCQPQRVDTTFSTITVEKQVYVEVDYLHSNILINEIPKSTCPGHAISPAQPKRTLHHIDSIGDITYRHSKDNGYVLNGKKHKILIFCCNNHLIVVQQNVQDGEVHLHKVPIVTQDAFAPHTEGVYPVSAVIKKNTTLQIETNDSQQYRVTLA